MTYWPPVLFLMMAAVLWARHGGSYAMSYLILGIGLCLSAVCFKIAWILWRDR